MDQEKCVIYCRVSSREQEETGYSLDAQEKFLRAHAEKNKNEVTEVFKVVESASKSQIRKTLNEMLIFVNKNHINIILCEKIDRLTRNLKDAAVIDDWVHEESVREVHFVKENFVLSNNTRAHENLVWDMKVAIARFYTNNLSEEVLKGQREKIAQGWLPTKPPLGYRTVGEKGHKIHVIDEDKACYIRRAFELYAMSNHSLKALRDLLYQEGLRTRTGQKLSKSRLADILSDPFYTGAIRWKSVVYENGKHEPLVSKDLFDKVQNVLQGKTAPHKYRHTFIFTKRLKCGECGGTVSGYIAKDGVRYEAKNHKPGCSQHGTTHEKEIENKLLGVFKFFENLTPAEAEDIYTKIRENHQVEAEYKADTLRALEARYSELQRRLDVLYDDRLAQRITQERWQSKQKEIDDEQAQIRLEMERIKSRETKYFELYINILDLARRARAIYENERRTPEERRQLLQHIFSTLMLKDQDVLYSLKVPIEKLSKRVQEKLDAEMNLRTAKNPCAVKVKTTSVPKNNPLLRG